MHLYRQYSCMLQLLHFPLNRWPFPAAFLCLFACRNHSLTLYFEYHWCFCVMNRSIGLLLSLYVPYTLSISIHTDLEAGSCSSHWRLLQYSIWRWSQTRRLHCKWRKGAYIRHFMFGIRKNNKPDSDNEHQTLMFTFKKYQATAPTSFFFQDKNMINIQDKIWMQI